MKLWLGIFILVITSCKTMDRFSGIKRFEVLPADSKIDFKYHGDSVKLFVNGERIATLTSQSRKSQHYDAVKWEGERGGMYLSSQCNKLNSKGERGCQLYQVTECKAYTRNPNMIWSEKYLAKAKCDSYQMKKTLIANMNIVKPSFYVEGQASSLNAINTGDFKVKLFFDGEFITAFHGVVPLEAKKNKPIYSGEIGQYQEAYIFCQKGGNKKKAITCRAYRDSKYQEPLNLIGQTKLPFSSVEYTVLDRLSKLYYFVDRWPHLNPNNKEVPFSTVQKSSYASLLQKEFDLWKN